MSDPTFSTTKIAELFGFSRRQLIYWAAVGHMKPSASPADSRAAVYSLGDAIQFWLIAELTNVGYSTRKALALAGRFHDFVVDKNIRIDDSTTILIDKKDQLLFIRGKWWPESGWGNLKHVVAFSKLWDRFLADKILP